MAHRLPDIIDLDGSSSPNIVRRSVAAPTVIDLTDVPDSPLPAAQPAPPAGHRRRRVPPPEFNFPAIPGGAAAYRHWQNLLEERLPATTSPAPSGASSRHRGPSSRRAATESASRRGSPAAAAALHSSRVNAQRPPRRGNAGNPIDLTVDSPSPPTHALDLPTSASSDDVTFVGVNVTAPPLFPAQPRPPSRETRNNRGRNTDAARPRQPSVETLDLDHDPRFISMPSIADFFGNFPSIFELARQMPIAGFEGLAGAHARAAALRVAENNYREPPPNRSSGPSAQPEPPAADRVPNARDGFTRDTAENLVAVCPGCGEELAYDPSDSGPVVAGGTSKTAIAAQKRIGSIHFWAVKLCGHVSWAGLGVNWRTPR
jgi:hypothetical protein